MGLARHLGRVFAGARSTITKVPAGLVIYALGDVHGCDRLLELMLTKIRTDALATKAQPLLVLLGDYIDRGPATRQVIERLLTFQAEAGFAVNALMGNHEAVLLSFLDDPTLGESWIDHGGAQTVASYGLEPPGPDADRVEWWRFRDRLRETIPEAHLRFLERLERCVICGDYAFVHAGVRPRIRLKDQTAHDLMWIRDDFLAWRRPFEKVIVHGHTVETQAVLRTNRIGVDTGAYRTGVLTAVRLMGSEQAIIQVQTNDPPHDRRVIVVSGDASEAGKSTLAISLALALAHAGVSVTVADLDFRRRTVSEFLE